jgi:hypothetical protein
MALRVEVLPDGTLHYISDGPVVFTGPISGTVTLPGGEVVNVTPSVIEVRDDDHGLQIAEAIGHRHAAEGHPDFRNEPHDFVFVPREG